VLEINKNTVSIAKYDDTIEPLREAITLCDGFAELEKDHDILIKPNIVWGGGLLRGVPKYGFITTARMIEDIIILLREYGCENITVGEGTVIDKSLGSNTKAGFKWSGIKNVAKKHDVKLIDLNEGPFKSVEFGDTKLNISEPALTSDFMINVPVLKTHYQAMVSLGLKNLKGCIAMESRRLIHKKGIAELIAHLGNYFKPNLTIIDGIYGLEEGPTPNGRAHRMNVIITGRDTFSCDIVGAAVLGFDPLSLPKFQAYSKITDAPLNMKDIVIKGKTIEEVKKELKWEVDYNRYFEEAEIEGMRIQSMGESICTGCVTGFESIIALFCTDYKGETLDNVEICGGSDVKALEDSNRVILLGTCSIGANKDLEDAIRIDGCPPDPMKFLKALYGSVGKKRVLLSRVFKLLGSKLKIYEEYLLKEEYEPPEFDSNHFK